MKRRKRSDGDPAKGPTGYVGDHADKLSRVRPMPHDEDERPSAEDRDSGTTIFTWASGAGLRRGRRRKPS